MKTKRIASVFGEPNKITYIIAKNLNKNSSILIPDGYDGLNALPFLVNGHTVTIYEPDTLFIDGEEILTPTSIYGLNRRIEAYGYKKSIKCINQNYYTSKAYKKYDHVFVFKSLHRECNNKISIKDKLIKLIKAVNDTGSIYIYYHLPIDENTNINSYPNPNEIIKFFDPIEWDIVLSKERKKTRLDRCNYGYDSNQYRKIGYIHAKRKITGSLFYYWRNLILVKFKSSRKQEIPSS